MNNVYQHNLTIINHTNVSYMGGAGGLRAVPSAQDRLAEHDNHVQVTADEARHISGAEANPAFALSHNNGHPAILATSRPAAFQGGDNQKPLASTAGHAVTNNRQMNRPAIPTNPAEHAAAPTHHENGPQKQ
ncbi:hypothetical protein [Acidocella aquatica]|uniref:hypothetical protein n=1 Tax=Acidocella aquatica TaxID=1922313 RepID=UPI0024E0E638|nr:hypothetical protein [Acidocella aquatica]